MNNASTISRFLEFFLLRLQALRLLWVCNHTEAVPIAAPAAALQAVRYAAAL